MKRYFDEVVSHIGKSWNQFWFVPLDGDVLARVRPFICAVTAIWFLVSLAGSEWWFGQFGWSSADLARQLTVASEGTWSSRFHISPLWSSTDAIVFQIWAAIGVVLAILAALGVGGRVVMFALFASVLFLAQRLTWTSGALEPLLIAFLAYLVIDPGRSWLKRADGEVEPRATRTLATRLIQFHVWLLLAAAFFSQLSSLPWWRGDAFWWLAVTGDSQMLTPEVLRGKILLVNALTHAVLICTGISVVALWSPLLRPIGVVCGCVLGGAYALLGDQTLYGLLLITGLLTFWPGQHSRP